MSRDSRNGPPPARGWPVSDDPAARRAMTIGTVHRSRVGLPLALATATISPVGARVRVVVRCPSCRSQHLHHLRADAGMLAVRRAPCGARYAVLAVPEAVRAA